MTFTQPDEYAAAEPSGPGRTPPAHDVQLEKGMRRLEIERLPDHRDRLFRAAYSLCGSREEAEDLVQETFLRVLQRPRFLRRDDDLGYLLRVLRNTWINTYKERQRRPKTVEFDDSVDFVLDPGADPSVSLGDVQVLYQAVHELSPALRETLIAVDVLGLSYKQAAHALRVRQGTIMSRLFRARNQVARRLEETDIRRASENSDV
jgi:RNA polymerase sigma-70 factor, ECF subfamily